jgi:hypothetical protein
MEEVEIPDGPKPGKGHLPSILAERFRILAALRVDDGDV